MMNILARSRAASAGLSRLHHATVKEGAPAAACVITACYSTSGRMPVSQKRPPFQSEQKLHHYLDASTVHHTSYSVWTAVGGAPLSVPSCRVPCLPMEKCLSHSCCRLFATSGPLQALTKSSAILPDDKPGIVTRVLDSVGITGKLRYNRFKMRVAGLNMYKACADGYNFETFFRACNMPDTLFSWFLIMELHVWMCMVRLKQEGREGKYLSHYLMIAMWHDIQARGKLMGISSVKMKEGLSKMVEQFNGALFAYDEGLLSSDKVLAAALWRNLFLRNCDDPERLANMVEYVRQQIQYLDSLDTAKFLQVGRIKWLPYRGGVPEGDTPLPKAASAEEELNIPDVDKVSL